MPYIAIIPNYWARHDDPQEALRLAKREAGKSREKKTPYRIYEVEDPEAYCNEVDGNISHRKGSKVSLFERYDPPSKGRSA